MPPYLSQSDALAKVAEGNLAISSGRADVGFSMCLAAAGNAQMRGQAARCMGEAEFGRGRYAEAVRLGKQALKANGAGKDTYLLLGKAMYKLKDCKNAKSYWMHVLNTDSSNPEALAGLDKCP
jgi:tetratricopeptide (TPR) repeat protein